MSLNIERSAKRVDVDNRIALRYYYRIADNLIRQVMTLAGFWLIFSLVNEAS
jgi:hypothetical protein